MSLVPLEKALLQVPPHQQRPAPSGGARKSGRTRLVRTDRSSGKKRKYQSPKIGRGAYVNAPNKPHWSHNLGNTKFWANAAVNNAGPSVASTAAGTALLAQTQRSKMGEKGKRRLDTATGAAAAGAATQAAGQKRMYRQTREYQKPSSNTDWADPKDVRNPAKSLPSAEKKKFQQLKSGARRAQAEAGGSKRAFAEHFNANFPEGYKTSKVRRAIGSGKATRNVNRASLAAGAVGGAAVYGAHKIKSRVKKNMSAFGVEHG